MPEANVDRLIDRRIKDFVLEQRIGDGGMGCVYIARHYRFKNLVCVIKTLLPEHWNSQLHRDRFMREAEAHSKLTHRNIVSMRSADTEPDGLCFIALEPLSGEDLETLLKRRRELDGHGRLDVFTAFAILLQAANAIQFAHSKGVIHRDLKPGNIMLLSSRVRSGDIDVKVIDFGLAKDRSAIEDALTKTGTVMGTPVYMAYEQLAGSSQISARADVFALGVIFWEMLTGQLPWGIAAPPVLYKAQETAPSVPESMPNEIAIILLQTLSTDPLKRPRSARELVMRLAAVIENGSKMVKDIAPELLETDHQEMTLRNVPSQDQLVERLYPRIELRASPIPGLASAAFKRRAPINPMLVPTQNLRGGAGAQLPAIASPEAIAAIGARAALADGPITVPAMPAPAPHHTPRQQPAVEPDGRASRPPIRFALMSVAVVVIASIATWFVLQEAGDDAASESSDSAASTIAAHKDDAIAAPQEISAPHSGTRSAGWSSVPPPGGALSAPSSAGSGAASSGAAVSGTASSAAAERRAVPARESTGAPAAATAAAPARDGASDPQSGHAPVSGAEAPTRTRGTSSAATPPPPRKPKPKRGAAPACPGAAPENADEKGALVVTMGSEKTWAVVFVDGVRLGQAPKRVDPIAVGCHKIVFSNDDDGRQEVWAYVHPAASGDTIVAKPKKEAGP